SGIIRIPVNTALTDGPGLMVRGGRHKACVPQAARRTSPSTAPWFAHPDRDRRRAGLAVMYRSTPEIADDKASGGGSARARRYP
ncbi:MAG: hypothetical protein WCC90_13935, partial [Methylocella sp.]